VSGVIELSSTGVLVILLAACAAAAQDDSPIKVSYTVNPQHVLNRVDEKVYGHFFEHIYHSANGGLWGVRYSRLSRPDS
jgi:alpha-N-arabinofuranosidase